MMTEMTAIAIVDSDCAKNKSALSGAPGLPGRPLSEHGAHQNAEIQPGNVDQIALVDVLAMRRWPPSSSR